MRGEGMEGWASNWGQAWGRGRGSEERGVGGKVYAPPTSPPPPQKKLTKGGHRAAARPKVDDEEVEEHDASEDDEKPEERLYEDVPAGQRGVVVAIEGVRCRVRDAPGPVTRGLPAAGQLDRAVVDGHAHPRLEEGAAAAAGRGARAHRVGHADAVAAREGVAPPEAAQVKGERGQGKKSVTGSTRETFRGTV